MLNICLTLFLSYIAVVASFATWECYEAGERTESFFAGASVAASVALIVAIWH